MDSLLNKFLDQLAKHDSGKAKQNLPSRMMVVLNDKKTKKDNRSESFLSMNLPTMPVDKKLAKELDKTHQEIKDSQIDKFDSIDGLMADFNSLSPAPQGSF